jgi:hypothetical protein
LDLRIPAQPTDSVCGQTCLYALYRYFDVLEELDQVIADIDPLPKGGTLAVQLGCHALERGMVARIYTNNLQMFDPTWFSPGVDLRKKLKLQAATKQGEKHGIATQSYLEFLDLGGEVLLESLTPRLLRNYIDRKVPILAGLSATYLYACARELPDGTYDDVAGSPTGHFVIILGYDRETERVKVADPLSENPAFEGQYYSVDLQRLLTAISLGIVTYDANLLVIEPRK